MIRKKITPIQDKLILVVLTIFFLIQGTSLFLQPSIWWDSSVYLGMGKFIYSFGKVGLWEASRPLVWPIILGLFWKLNLDPVFFGKLTIILFSLGCIILTYIITKKIFNVKIAFFSAIFLAFSPTFYLFTTVLQTEIPSLFFILFALYLFIKKKYSISGLFFGVAVMTRFFVIFTLIPIILFLLFQLFKEKKGNSIVLFFLFFLITIIPYLILNNILYKNILYPFILQASMTKNTGWVFHQPFYFYFFGLIKENMFTLFSILGILAIFRKKEKWQMLIFLILIFTFIPFNLTAHKEMRLLLLSLPYIYMTTVCGLVSFSKLFIKKQKIIFVLFALIWVLQTVPQLKFNSYDDGFDPFYDYIETARIDYPLWISNPAFIVYSDYKANLIYYPNLNIEKIKELDSEIFDAKHILINTCDIPCPPIELGCEQSKAEFIQKIKNNFKTFYFKKVWECEYYIFEE